RPSICFGALLEFIAGDRTSILSHYAVLGQRPRTRTPCLRSRQAERRPRSDGRRRRGTTETGAARSATEAVCCTSERLAACLVRCATPPGGGRQRPGHASRSAPGCARPRSRRQPADRPGRGTSAAGLAFLREGADRRAHLPESPRPRGSRILPGG